MTVLRETLKGLFSGYGPVLSVQAHANVRMRGQAFVALPDKRQAAKAVKEVAGFPLYGKPMQLAFAKSKSISVLEKQDPENVEERKKELKMHQYKQRRGSKLRRNELAAKIAEKRGGQIASLLWSPACIRKLTRLLFPLPTAAAGELDPTTAGALPGASKRQEIAMPDEYLPPNKLLFVQNLPEGTSREDIEALFSSLSNFNDVRSVPGNTKIAFVEFADIPSSSAARESLNGHTFPSGEKIKVTLCVSIAPSSKSLTRCYPSLQITFAR